MKNIYQVSSRTREKIIKRLNLSCFNCKWDKAPCDIHHIIPKSKGGSDHHENLTILCPNCHRLAHYNIIENFINLEEKLGEQWKNVYYIKTRNGNSLLEHSKKGNLASLEVRRNKYKSLALEKINKIKESNIDFSKFGWVEKVSREFNIRHQHVSKLLKKYDADFYHTCYKRNK